MVFLRHIGLFFLLLVLAWPPTAIGEAVLDSDGAQMTEFDNGLQLLVLNQPHESLVQVDVYLSLRGAARNRGMAHLIEHLMFRSSENCPAGSLRDSLQLLTTYHQGSTSPRNIHTRTCCLPNLLPRLLAVEAERFGRLQPDENDLEHEKNRVLGEQDFRLEKYVRMALDLRVIAMAYDPEEEGDPLLGSPESISGTGMAEVDTFLTRWLRPDKIVVLISGPVEPDNVVPLVSATFGTIPRAITEPAMVEIPLLPDPKDFVTRSSDEDDLLAVGFRLPYGTPEEAAMVHLTDTIMEREDGKPSLRIFDDEAILIIHLQGDWSRERSDQEGAEKAYKQFWDETRTVKHRVRDSWLFDKNRVAHVKDLRRRLGNPYLRAIWSAQGLADDREIPDPDLMATVLDSLGQERIEAFFAEQFSASRAFSAYAAGRAPKDKDLASWNRRLRMRLNPYLIESSGAEGLGVAEIDPILASAVGLGGIETMELPNGIPVYIRTLPGESRVYIGGVRTFFPLYEESRTRSPGRMILYNWLADAGYDSKGSQIPPVGKKPGYHTSIMAEVNYLRITAYGPEEKFKNVATAMHKRIAIDHLNPYVLRHYIENGQELFRDYLDTPERRAYSWLLDTVYGPDHPFAGWVKPDGDSIADWSIKDANKLHQKLCRTGNFQIVVAGDIDRETVKEKLASTFSLREEAEPGAYPIETHRKLTGQGIVVHNGGSALAVIKFMFRPRPMWAQPSLQPVDIMLIERLFESRLRVAAVQAGLDSVSVAVNIQPAGACALPLIQMITRADDAPQALELVRAEVTRLKDDPASHHEEARARLSLLSYLLDRLHYSRSTRDLLLDFGLFGEIPDNPLGHLCMLEYGVAAEQAASLFSATQHAWTVMGDTTLEVIRKLGPVLD
jgi:predicted Zn-dependent peptidase